MSNFPTALLERAVAILGQGRARHQPGRNASAFLQNRKVLERCDAHGVAVTAYMPLGQGRVLGDPTLTAIAERMGDLAGLVALAWLIQLGVIVIPASTSRANMAANLTAADLRLSDADMAVMAGTDRNNRMINPAKSPDWD